MPINSNHEIAILMQFIIMCIVIVRMTEQFMHNNTINLFMILLIINQAIIILKRLAVVMDPDLGVISFYLGGAILIFFGIAFSFINIHTKNFKLIKADKY